MTDLPPFIVSVGTTGNLTGIVNGTGATMSEPVELIPAAGAPTMVVPNDDGAFFLSGLEQGDWTARYQFAGLPSPTEVDFVITANEITSINIQFVDGGGGPQGETITVLVLQDDDDPSTPMTPVSTASVLLRGTDSGSMSGLVATTDAMGMAVFNNVTGPYDVTAQKDILVNAETVRFAVSTVGIAPADGTIGMWFDNDDNNTPATLDATMSGTVSNLPVLNAGEALQVQVEPTGLTDGDVFFGAVNPGDGTYSVSIPSGVDFDVSLNHFEQGADSEILATLLQPSVAQTTPGGTITQDFDFNSPTVIAWDQAVPTTITNVMAGAGPIAVCVDLVDDTNGVLFAFEINTNAGASFTMNLPDLTDPALAGYELQLLCEVEHATNFSGQECDVIPASNPASVAFDMLSLATPIMPFDGATYTVQELEDLSVSFTEGGNGNFGANGVNIFSIESQQGGPAGVDLVVWDVFVPAGTSSFSMPQSSLPMFPENTTFDSCVQSFRVAGFTIDFDSFFSSAVEQNFSMLMDNQTSACGSEVALSIGTSGPP